jgi:hypothetical protein
MALLELASGHVYNREGRTMAKRERRYRVESTAYHAVEMARYEGSRIVACEHDYYTGPEWCLYEPDAETNPMSALHAYTRHDYVIAGVPNMARWRSFGYWPIIER